MVWKLQGHIAAEKMIEMVHYEVLVVSPCILKFTKHENGAQTISQRYWLCFAIAIIPSSRICYANCNSSWGEQ